MKDRIIQLLTKENLTATRFADIIGVQRSSISHLLSGRNKPSFDFIEKTLLKFPKIDSEWLILGKGSMFKQEKVQTNNNNPENISSVPKQSNIFDNQKVITKDNNPKTNISSKVTTVNNKRLVKVVLFYDDHSFSEYSPE